MFQARVDNPRCLIAKTLQKCESHNRSHDGVALFRAKVSNKSAAATNQEEWRAPAWEQEGKYPAYHRLVYIA